MSPLILVVDDHDAWRDLLVARLHRLGVTTCEATDVARAVAVLERTPVDLVVTDHRMPGGSGLDLLLFARERAPGVPVVLVSASVSDELARAAVNGGALAVLEKADVLSALESLLGRLEARGAPEVELAAVA